jgi:hypothetical protein
MVGHLGTGVPEPDGNPGSIRIGVNEEKCHRCDVDLFGGQGSQTWRIQVCTEEAEGPELSECQHRRFPVVKILGIRAGLQQALCFFEILLAV